MTKDIILRKITGLQTRNFNYAEKLNAFVGNGYTSMAGNHYFNALRFAEGIVIKEDIGQGYMYTFLNGLKVYSLKDKTLIADACFHKLRYTKEVSKGIAKEILLKKLQEAARHEGFKYDAHEAERVVTQIIDEAFFTDQRAFAANQMKRLST